MPTYIVTMPDAYWGTFAHVHGYFSRSTPATTAGDAIERLREPIRQAIATIPGDAADYYIVSVYPALLPTERRSFAVDPDGVPIDEAPLVRQATIR